VLIGDSDIVRPEHAVQLFRLRGRGVELVERADWLVSMISAFLDAAAPEAAR
jgi:hypothetical protein